MGNNGKGPVGGKLETYRQIARTGKTAREALSADGNGSAPLEQKAGRRMKNMAETGVGVVRVAYRLRKARSAREVMRENAAVKAVAKQKRGQSPKDGGTGGENPDGAQAAKGMAADENRKGADERKREHGDAWQGARKVKGNMATSADSGKRQRPGKPAEKTDRAGKWNKEKKQGAANTKKTALFQKRRAKNAVKTEAAVKSAEKGAKAARRAKRTALAASNPVTLILVLIMVALLIIASVVMMVFYAGAGADAVKDAWGEISYLDSAVVAEMRKNITAEWFQSLRATREDLTTQGYASGNIRVRYNFSPDSDNDGTSRLDNWNDVLAVWLVLNNRAITPEDEAAVRDIYFTMNPVAVATEEPPVPPDESGQGEDEGQGSAPPDVPTPPPEDTLAYIDVRNLRCADVAETYGLTAEMIAKTEEWLNPTSDRNAFWVALLGASVSPGDDYAGIYTNLPPSGAVTRVLEEAARRNGWIYDNGARMRDGFDDCSSLVWGCYMAVGIDFGDSGYAPTAAAIAQWCDERNLRVDPAQRQAGDLIFWAGSGNGRYLNIYHTAIYVGDGKMWEAAPSAGGVVFRDVNVQRPANIIFYARPTAA